MNLLIDNLNSITGWTTSGSATFGLNDWKEYIAGELSNSLIINFPANSQGQTVTKTISPAIDVSKYDYISFYIWSKNQPNQGTDYQLPTDFAYSINFGDSNNYLVPTFKNFSDVNIFIKGQTTSISQIQITALTNNADSIIISFMNVSKDEYPRDIFEAIKNEVTNQMNKQYANVIINDNNGNHITNGVLNNGILLGEISCNAGDTSIILPNPFLFIEKYSTILINDGVNSEQHQIDSNDELEYKFNSMFSGKTMINNFTNANMYLVLPIAYGLNNEEILLPGMAISGFNSEEIFRSIKEENDRDTFLNNTVNESKAPVSFKFPIVIDCNARHDSLLSLMSMICRQFIARQYIWVNGKKFNVFAEGGSVYSEPDSDVSQIPKNQFPFFVEVKEDVFDRHVLAQNVNTNITYTMSIES